MKWPATYKHAQYQKTRCPVAENAFANELCALSHTVLLADRKTLNGIAEAIAKVKANVDALLQAKG
jgi:hypothetical protein